MKLYVGIEEDNVENVFAVCADSKEEARAAIIIEYASKECLNPDFREYVNDDSTNFSINENFWDFKSDLDNYELQQKYDQNIREFYGEEYSEYADEFIKSADAGDHYFTDHFYQITCEKLCTLESIKWTDFYIQEIDVSIKAEYKNEKVISHGGFWCKVCKDYLERDNVLDPEFGCGRCSTDDWDNARIVVQVVDDDND